LGNTVAHGACANNCYFLNAHLQPSNTFENGIDAVTTTNADGHQRI
jgi:hypothetical protein